MRRTAAWFALLLGLNALAAEPLLPMVDGDADGVSDDIDDCPYSEIAVRVDATGCAKGDGDRDGDGIADATDDCPFTPPGALVNPRGCALDTDFDGVADGLDACPNTQLGNRANAVGCSTGQTATAAVRPSMPAAVVAARTEPAAIAKTVAPVVAAPAPSGPTVVAATPPPVFAKPVVVAPSKPVTLNTAPAVAATTTVKPADTVSAPAAVAAVSAAPAPKRVTESPAVAEVAVAPDAGLQGLLQSLRAEEAPTNPDIKAAAPRNKSAPQFFLKWEPGSPALGELARVRYSVEGVEIYGDAADQVVALGARLRSLLLQTPDVQIELQAYHGSAGVEADKTRALTRAQLLRALLKAQGIPASHLSIATVNSAPLGVRVAVLPPPG